METNFPRIRAGEISAIYIGERFEASPIPMPPIIRNTLKKRKFPAKAVPTAETVKSRPDKMSRRFRPDLSLMIPDKTAPIRHPNSALLCAKPRRKGVASVIPK